MDELFDYENLVYSIINKYGNYFDKDDLYQVGMIGLINAYNHFDSSIDIKFSSYAYYYILGEVTKFVRENRTIKVGKDTLKLYGAIEKSRDLMRQRLGREPSDFELSIFMEIDEEKISSVKQSVIEVESLDYQYEEDVNLYNSVKTIDKETDASYLDLKDAISELSDEEQQLLYRRYYDDMTQSEVSKHLGISQVQVSRKEGKILQKIKTKLVA